MSEFRRHLASYQEWVPALDEVQLEHLESHFLKLTQWMGKMNLTSLTSHEEIVLRHYVESMWLGVRVPGWVRTVVDAGSGAGFPGVPVAVVSGVERMVLVEADRRKAVFLRESTLGIENVKVKSERLEGLNLEVDGVVSRGVRIQEVMEYARRHAKWCGVLTSVEIAGKFSWEVCERLPWDREHVVAFLKVPRETT